MANRFIDVTLRLIDRATTPLSNIGARLTESSRQWIRAGNQIQKTGQKITKTGDESDNESQHSDSWSWCGSS